MKEEEIKEEIKKLEKKIQSIKNDEWMVWVLFLGGLVFLFVMGLGLIMIILALLWNWE
jgi:hypoxanthine-guanine phosphoribosyltransferase